MPVWHRRRFIWYCAQAVNTASWRFPRRCLLNTGVRVGYFNIRKKGGGEVVPKFPAGSEFSRRRQHCLNEYRDRGLELRIIHCAENVTPRLG